MQKGHAFQKKCALQKEAEKTLTHYLECHLNEKNALSEIEPIAHLLEDRIKKDFSHSELLQFNNLLGNTVLGDGKKEDLRPLASLLEKVLYSF